MAGELVGWVDTGRINHTKSYDDELLRHVTAAMNEFTEMTGYGACLVNVFPTCALHICYFTGFAWKRKVPRLKANMKNLINVLLNWSKQQLKSGIAQPDLVKASPARGGRSLQQERDIKYAAVEVYGGGADAEPSFYATAARRRHNLIDRVVEADCLPMLDDYRHLPYVEILFLEILRLYPLTLLAEPYVAGEEDYPNPDVFSPERLPPRGMILRPTWASVVSGQLARDSAAGGQLSSDMFHKLDAKSRMKDCMPVLLTQKFSDGPTMNHSRAPTASVCDSKQPETVTHEDVPQMVH
ncbi:hypothetical protein BDQ17DRAFT_1427668 [Cyathus striatus]|nr:hypothetical protein BDQ17DRAFT_1427668 [Cyathus striatus]